MPLLEVYLVSLCSVKVRAQLIKHYIISKRKRLGSNVIVVILKRLASKHNRECYFILLILINPNLSAEVVKHLNLRLKDIVFII
jgi:hypothetical protein